jgi:methyltransferase (TIGR00027 family)
MEAHMSVRNASQTAMATAYLRAAHQLLDASPRLFEDPIALALLGPDSAKQITASVARYQSPDISSLREHAVLRARFTEDRLAQAVERGARQYVVLGAGMDTFAFRQPPWAHALQIFEVDHPGTQSIKRAQLAQAGIQMPKNGAFVAIDFEHTSLLDGLQAHHVPLNKQTFFSWLGVTMYLHEAAIDAALKSMATFPPGSEVVLTFLDAQQTASAQFDALASQVANLGEPFISRFAPDALEAKLRQAGFSEIEFLTRSAAEKRYLLNGLNASKASKQTGIVAAIV